MVHDADAITRFNREASNASRINHQHVAGIYDFGETAEGLIYLAMEFVEGEPLVALMERAGALSPSRAAELTRQTGEALSVAHDMGIVHRDLKPDNIMIGRNRDGSDCVKVVDFGIAKAANVEGQKVTRTGHVIGTPEYMSPEQLAGDPLDGRSDIYSLGLVAFHMLTGGLPFPSETVQESMIMRLTDKPKRLAEMRPQTPWPPAVQDVMDRVLQRDVKERYQSANEFGRALVAAVKTMPVAALAGATPVATPKSGGTVPPTRISEHVSPMMGQPLVMAPKRSRMRMVVGGGLGVLGLVAVVGTVTVMSDRASKGNAAAASAIPAGGAAVHSPVGGAKDSSSSTPAGQLSSRQPTVTPGPRVSETGRRSEVSGVGSAPSYAAELEALAASVDNPESAARVAPSLPAWQKRVTLAADRAAVQFVEAKVTLFTAGATKGCALMRRIKRNDLGASLKQPYDEGLQSCEGT
jgi:serine/threonine-protein kinase